ncbi:MAG: T9SS type A sorting domain-containing protein [Bacteroidetes bacterium]|nr:T9SS type A sorting domain-containing protein [Bacteroidota bacterium]
MKRLFTFSFLLGSIFLLFPNAAFSQCDPDVTPPFLECHSGLQVSLPWITGQEDLWAEDFIENVGDFCDLDNLILEASLNGGPFASSFPVDCDDIGSNTVEVQATDQSGNTASCTLSLEVADLIAPVLACDDNTQITLPSNGMLYLTPGMILEGGFPVDNCAGDLIFSVSLDDDPAQDSILLTCAHIGDFIVSISVEDTNGNLNLCWGQVTIDGGSACEEVQLTGNVFQDINSDCILDAGENGLDGWTVQVQNDQGGTPQDILVDASGNYNAASSFNMSDPNTSFTVSIPGAGSNILPCGTSYTVPVSAGVGSVNQDIPVFLQMACPLLNADIAVPVLRACMSSTYSLSFCSFSGFLIEDAYMEVTLDPNLTVTSSSIPWSAVNGNTYTFDLGDIDPAECDQFSLEVDVACDVEQGQTLCSEVTIYPAEICAPVDPGYSGASLKVSSECVGDKVRFTLRNDGTAPMAESQNYVIVEDVIMYMQTPFELEPGEEVEIEVPANGSTWRFEAPNEVLYPGDFQPIAWYEGCGGINNTGLVNQFPVDINEPFRAVFCLEVTGSYDPNDKRGFPYGVGEEHFVKKNTDLDYMIRFQNTGTDTAFNVYILDTLDVDFQPGSVRAGASSHPYQFEVLDGGVLKFSFPDILLPDSTTNEAASHGFVSFEISQREDLQPGTMLTNSAAIYFDFNEPVITNETWHQVEEIVFSDLELISLSAKAFSFSPNPVSDQLRLKLDNKWRGTMDLYILNSLGQRMDHLIFEKSSENWEAVIPVQNLISGAYIMVLSNGKQMITETFIRQ